MDKMVFLTQKELRGRRESPTEADLRFCSGNRKYSYDKRFGPDGKKFPVIMVADVTICPGIPS